MSLRRKACFGCVRAKRRCDRGLPACERCSRQSLTCEYYSPPLPCIGATADGPANSSEFDAWSLSQGTHTITNTGIAMPDTFTCPTSAQITSVLPFETDSFSTPPFNAPTDTLGHLQSWNQSLQGPESFLPATEYMVPTQPMPRVGVQCELPQPQFQLYDELHDIAGSLPISQNNSTASVLEDYASARSNQPLDADYVSDIPRLMCIEQMWSRGQDTPRWEFCANEVLSFVYLFSRTGSAPFLVTRNSSDSLTENTPVPLTRAMGVCAAYITANDTGRPVFEQLLEMEAKALIESSNSEYFGFKSSHSELDKLRAELVRVQVMTMYRIICFFSPSQRLRSLAESQEALVTSWTRQLLLRLHVLEKEIGVPSPSASSSKSLSSVDIEHTQPCSTIDGSPKLLKEVTTSAYKTVLMSHLVHTIYTSLKYQVCRNLPELRSIPILTSTLGDKTRYPGLFGPPLPPEMSGCGHRRPSKMAYIDYSDSWHEEELRYLDRGDRFTVLVLAACKGIDFLNLC